MDHSLSQESSPSSTFWVHSPALPQPQMPPVLAKTDEVVRDKLLQALKEAEIEIDVEMTEESLEEKMLNTPSLDLTPAPTPETLENITSDEEINEASSQLERELSVGSSKEPMPEDVEMRPRSPMTNTHQKGIPKQVILQPREKVEMDSKLSVLATVASAVKEAEFPPSPPSSKTLTSCPAAPSTTSRGQSSLSVAQAIAINKKTARVKARQRKETRDQQPTVREPLQEPLAQQQVPSELSSSQNQTSEASPVEKDLQPLDLSRQSSAIEQPADMACSPAPSEEAQTPEVPEDPEDERDMRLPFKKRNRHKMPWKKAYTEQARTGLPQPPPEYSDSLSPSEKAILYTNTFGLPCVSPHWEKGEPDVHQLILLFYSADQSLAPRAFPAYTAKYRLPRPARVMNVIRAVSPLNALFRAELRNVIRDRQFVLGKSSAWPSAYHAEVTFLGFNSSRDLSQPEAMVLPRSVAIEDVSGVRTVYAKVVLTESWDQDTSNQIEEDPRPHHPMPQKRFVDQVPYGGRAPPQEAVFTPPHLRRSSREDWRGQQGSRQRAFLKERPPKRSVPGETGEAGTTLQPPANEPRFRPTK